MLFFIFFLNKWKSKLKIGMRCFEEHTILSRMLFFYSEIKIGLLKLCWVQCTYLPNCTFPRLGLEILAEQKKAKNK